MNSRRYSMLITLAASICAVALPACGSSGKPTANVSSKLTLGVRFATCMRSHGVPSFPDPSANGPTQIGPGNGIDPRSPAFQAAQRACGQGPGISVPRAMSESQKLAAIAFAKCMRSHGQANFPDPTLTAMRSATRILALRGMVFALGPGIDPRSQAFTQAAAACGLGKP